MRQAGLIATALAAALAIAPAAQAKDVQAECEKMEWVKSGTFTAELTSVGLVIGARWGDGTVTLEDGTQAWSSPVYVVRTIGRSKSA